MSFLLQTNEKLSDDTPLYRTIDFYSAAQIVSKHKLMFSRADTFLDKNEGIDRLLGQLEAAIIDFDIGGFGWSNKETAKTQHQNIKQSYYISCWSTNPESVAMWSLYSNDFCSVRISTTVGKLKAATTNLIEKYPLSKIKNGQWDTVACEAHITPVTYASIKSITSRIRRRSESFKRLKERYERNGKPIPNIQDIDSRFWIREEQRKTPELKTVCTLKDTSFSHEQEVRAIVRLGNGRLNAEWFELTQEKHENKMQKSAILRLLSYFNFLPNDCTPKLEFSECPVNFIESIAIDPRCPSHKKEFIYDWFMQRNIRTVESSCFGYLPEKLDFFPKR